MKVWDAELLTAEKESGYIKNGLLLYVDGIQNTRSGHDASSSYWEDLSGNGNDLSIINPLRTTNIYLLDSSYFFAGDPSGGDRVQRMVLSNFGSMKGTYEIVLNNYRSSLNSYALAHAPAQNGQKCRAISFGSSGKLNANGNVVEGIRDTYTEFVNKRSTLTITEDANNPISYYVNGNISEISGSASSRVDSKNTMLILGARTYNNNFYDYFRGEIACVRIYDRVLTASEILHNYEIDKKRFGSGVFV